MSWWLEASLAFLAVCVGVGFLGTIGALIRLSGRMNDE